MTALLVVAAWVAMSCATAAMWAAIRTPARRERARRHEDQAIALTRPMRCLVCVGAPLIDDYRTHTRLNHRPRPIAAEDHPQWSTQ